MALPNPHEVHAFRRLVYAHYRKHARQLPWRKTRNPYRILVSEIMLQQTQVERVIPYYRNFLARFPTISVLARASLKEALAAWQGLGYNRRGKLLHECARTAMEAHGGKLPRTAALLENLPGIGPYTARAILAFAYNKEVAMIETNIRTVYLYHFFKNKTNVSDKEIVRYIVQTLDGKNPRKWYSALMDYGAHLKENGIRLNAKSKHYAKQSKFEGSTRQLRGRILKESLERGVIDIKKIAKEMRKPPRQVAAAADSLAREGLLQDYSKRQGAPE